MINIGVTHVVLRSVLRCGKACKGFLNFFVLCDCATGLLLVCQWMKRALY